MHGSYDWQQLGVETLGLPTSSSKFDLSVFYLLSDLLADRSCNALLLQLTCIMAADFSEGAETEAASGQEWRHKRHRPDLVC
ncbi:hypothetical protein WJX77_009571 [Trebouxia sp. C0004]